LYIFLKTGSSNKVGGGANHQPMPIQGPSQWEKRREDRPDVMQTARTTYTEDRTIQITKSKFHSHPVSPFVFIKKDNGKHFLGI
jgi:hypothetical protein